MEAEEAPKYPDLSRKQRETAILQKFPAIFIIGIGWTLKDGYPHEMRAADYDDWVTPTTSGDGKPMHGLNGDILYGTPSRAGAAAVPHLDVLLAKRILGRSA